MKVDLRELEQDVRYKHDDEIIALIRVARAAKAVAECFGAQPGAHPINYLRAAVPRLGQPEPTLADELLRTAATEKAQAFAEKIIASVRARGAQWMADHAVELQILDAADKRFCPVADNRNFYMSALQMALLK